MRMDDAMEAGERRALVRRGGGEMEKGEEVDERMQG